MCKYEELLIFAERNGIRVKEVDFETDKKCGYYSNFKILINSRLTEKEKYEVLAEELGHHFKTFGDISNQDILANRKQEQTARRYGFDFLVQLPDLIRAYENGCSSLYEIADFLGITVKQFLEILADFKHQFGQGMRFNHYYIRFEPTLGIIGN